MVWSSGKLNNSLGFIYRLAINTNSTASSNAWKSSQVSFIYKAQYHTFASQSVGHTAPSVPKGKKAYDKTAICPFCRSLWSYYSRLKKQYGLCQRFWIMNLKSSPPPPSPPPPSSSAAFLEMDFKCTVIHHDSALLQRADRNCYIIVFVETNNIWSLQWPTLPAEWILCWGDSCVCLRKMLDSIYLMWRLRPEGNFHFQLQEFEWCNCGEIF